MRQADVLAECRAGLSVVFPEDRVRVRILSPGRGREYGPAAIRKRGGCERNCLTVMGAWRSARVELEDGAAAVSSLSLPQAHAGTSRADRRAFVVPFQEPDQLEAGQVALGHRRELL